MSNQCRLTYYDLVTLFCDALASSDDNIRTGIRAFLNPFSITVRIIIGDGEPRATTRVHKVSIRFGIDGVYPEMLTAAFYLQHMVTDFPNSICSINEQLRFFVTGANFQFHIESKFQELVDKAKKFIPSLVYVSKKECDEMKRTNDSEDIILSGGNDTCAAPEDTDSIESLADFFKSHR